MFVAEDYRKLLSIGRQYAILLEVQDSLIILQEKLDEEVKGYIFQVENIRWVNDQTNIKIFDLKKDFKEYTDKTEKELNKLYRKNKVLKKVGIGVAIVAFIEAVILAIALK